MSTSEETGPTSPGAGRRTGPGLRRGARHGASPRRQREFAATIEGSRFLTLPEAYHWVVPERSDEVAALATRFFTDGPQDGPPDPPAARALPRQIPAPDGVAATWAGT